MNKDAVFVFGSNTAGIHGSGAARDAYKGLGARWGFSYGHMGNTFAVPTKGHTRVDKGTPDERCYVGNTLPLNEIGLYIAGFVMYAKHHPEIDFKVTRLGCGLAGLEDSKVAGMFNQLKAEALPNVFFDTEWVQFLSNKAQFWGTF